MVTNHVYTVTGAKGGVGKTTTSINLGASLAEAGYATVTVELDLAMANLVDFLELNIDLSTATTLYDVLAGEADVADAIYETDSGLSVVPSGTELTGYAETDLKRLPEVVETLRWHHDVVILDTPAGVGQETVRPIQLADEVLLISTPRVASIRNGQNTLELVERAGTDVRGLILTKSGTGASPGAESIADFLDVELLGHVPEDDAVPHSQDKGYPVVSNAPRSGAAIAYRKVSRQLVEGPPTDDSTGPSATSEKPDTVRTAGRTDGETGVEQASLPENDGRTRAAGSPDTRTEKSSRAEPSSPDAAEGKGPTQAANADDSGAPDEGVTAPDGPTEQPRAQETEATVSADDSTGKQVRDDGHEDPDDSSLGAQIRSLLGF